MDLTVSTHWLIFLKGQHLSNVPQAPCPSSVAWAEIRVQGVCLSAQLHCPVFPLNNAERPENVRNHTSWKRSAAERCVTLTRCAKRRICSSIRASPWKVCLNTATPLFGPCWERSHPYLLSRPAGSLLGATSHCTPPCEDRVGGSVGGIRRLFLVYEIMAMNKK